MVPQGIQQFLTFLQKYIYVQRINHIEKVSDWYVSEVFCHILYNAAYYEQGRTIEFTEAYLYKAHGTSLNYEYSVPKGVTKLIVITNYPSNSLVNANIPSNYYLSMTDVWGQSLLFYNVSEGDILSFKATASQNYNIILGIYTSS